MQSNEFTALTDAQIDQLDEFLDSVEGAMRLEEVAGFFCALISGPDLVMPSEYLPYVFGDEMPDIGSLKQAGENMDLLFQLWNDIADTLYRDEVYVPLLRSDKSGKIQANDFAHGYMAGVGMRREGWSDVINDVLHGGPLVPIMALHYEHADDPDMRPRPITDEQRENLVVHMTASILGIYRHFAAQRKQESHQADHRSEPMQHVQHIEPIQRSQPKIGRNDPCYCGSGKKFKHCHGGVTLH